MRSHLVYESNKMNHITLIHNHTIHRKHNKTKNSTIANNQLHWILNHRCLDVKQQYLLLSVPNSHHYHPHNAHHPYHLCCSIQVIKNDPIIKSLSDYAMCNSLHKIEKGTGRLSHLGSWCNYVMSILLLFVVMSSVGQGQSHLYDISCPSVNLIPRLTTPNKASSLNRNNSTQDFTNITPECDCTLTTEGWEITCLTNNNEIAYEDSNSSANKWSELDEFEYNGEIAYSFVIKYEARHHFLKIVCDKGVPAFKPALFQGFGLNKINSFMISNCELPQTLPLSFILDRTQTPNFIMTSTVGSHSFSINTTGQHVDIVSPIRTLIIDSRKRVSVTQLNTLLSDLKSLEELKLTNFDLIDIDSYGIETYDSHSSIINGFNMNHPKRVKRNKQVAINNNSNSINMTTNIMLETTTVLPLRETTKINNKNSNNPASVATSLPSSQIDINPEAKILNETLNSLDEQTATTITATARPEMMTTIMPDTNDIDIIQPEDINMTAMETMTTQTQKNDAINYEEDNLNDVNIENKPIFVLNENALNFARILPNIRILLLRNFVKESNIPNVIFQIIKGLDKLEILELRSNNLETVPSNAFAFAGSSLKSLYLSHNSIKEIDKNAFNNLTQLELLDISHNKLIQLNEYTLKPLKNLQFLGMYNNGFQNLSEYLFQANKKLISLDLSQNDHLQPLPPFHGLSSLSNLSLAHCNLTDISVDVVRFFRQIPNLMELNLRKNQLSNLTLNGLFSWNSKLTNLDFSSNQIKEISADVFNINSTRISEINLNKNQLDELPENLFIEARNVRKLSLSHNKLHEISSMTFKFLRMLEELDLSHNQITTLNTNLNPSSLPNILPFGTGSYLRKVDLSFNNLSDFDSEINRIDWGFYLSITELNLRDNNFSGTLSVPINMATSEPTFKLDVSNNNFESVDIQNILDKIFLNDKSQASITKETLVRLDNNPLNCDCFLFPFLNYTKSVGRIYSKHFDTIIRKTLFLVDQSTELVQCHKPEHLRNRLLDNLKLSELLCEIDDHRVCPVECNCNYRSSDQSAIVDCDNRNLLSIPEEMKLSQYYNISLKDKNVTVPGIHSVIYQLRENQIQSIKSLTPMISWTNDEKLKPSFVEILFDKNNITHLEPNLISDEYLESLVMIRKLSVQNNNIQKIPLKILQNFETISKINETKKLYRPSKSKIFMGYNPIDCHNDPSPPGSECYIRDFKLWLSSHNNLVGDVTSIKCDKTNLDLWQRVKDANSSLVIVNMSDDLLCPMLIPPTNNTTLMALSIICVVLASSLFVVSVLYYRNKQTILAFIYIHLNPIFICLSFTEDDLDEEKIYDAFVSYSSSDRDVVMELIEKLEKPHDMNEVSFILQNSLSIHEGRVDQVVPENVFKKSSTMNSTTKSQMDVENGGENSYRLCIHERDWLPGNLISWNIVNSVQNSKRTILILSESFIQSIWFQVEFHTAYYQMLEDKMDRLIVIVRGNLPPKDHMDKDLNFLLTTKTYLVWGEKWFWEKLYYAMPHKKKQPMKDKSEKDKLTSTIASNPKYNGNLNGRLSGISDGMLKWSHNNSSKPNAKAEVMKEYVDKTIASHFQLNSYSPNSLNSNLSTETYTKPNGNSISTNNHSSRPAPKSLRNSGTLATATPNTLKEFNYGNGAGIDNKSFIDETNT